MSDLGVVPTHILIQTNEVGIEEQELQIEKRELRLLELDDEHDRIRREQAGHEAEAKAADAQRTKAETAGSVIDARRAKITAAEHRLVINQRNTRLLEIEEERRQVGVDIAASRTHIKNLQAEVSQQRSRLNGQENAHG